MSQQTGVTVDGARELRRTLKKAGVDVKDNLKASHKSAAQIVMTRGADLCPVAPVSMSSAVPGLLRDSLRAAGTQTAAIVRAGNNRKTAKGVPYAGAIHWGWHKRNIRPNLFLTRAASETEPKWVEEYMNHMNEIIDKVKGA